jgi:hypothetical protein
MQVLRQRFVGHLGDLDPETTRQPPSHHSPMVGQRVLPYKGSVRGGSVLWMMIKMLRWICQA